MASRFCSLHGPIGSNQRFTTPFTTPSNSRQILLTYMVWTRTLGKAPGPHGSGLIVKQETVAWNCIHLNDRVGGCRRQATQQEFQIGTERPREGAQSVVTTSGMIDWPLALLVRTTTPDWCAIDPAASAMKVSLPPHRKKVVFERCLSDIARRMSAQRIEHRALGNRFQLFHR
jgi:hypothetical protein